jgi:tRNA threonylcarbamoyladenosine biosynthesis protein TsaB
MLILAFDTTSEKGGVGIFREAQCLASVENEGPANQYSVTLFEMVERALAQAHLQLSDIELYAVANGPGSFTGIRVGLAAARAWGKVGDRPVRGVSVLAALVNQAPLASDWVFPVLDARRSEFFLGCFRRIAHSSVRPGEYEPADAGWVLKPDRVRSFVEERLTDGASATGLVRAHDSAALALCETLPFSHGAQRVEGTLMDSIASLVRREPRVNALRSDSELDAYYIRRPDAEANWKD